MDGLKASSKTSLTFFLNGKEVNEPHVQADMTVLEYLRQSNVRLTGTKLGCGEGGCGACTVMVSHHDSVENKVVHRSTNACLAPLSTMEGCHITTVEGIGSCKADKQLHPIQDRMSKLHGSQCGYCTPGIVMAMYAILQNNPNPSKHQLEEGMDGNLCRCTGYRPILDAAKTFATDAHEPCHTTAASCTKHGSGGKGKRTAAAEENTEHEIVSSCSCSKAAPFPTDNVAASSLPFPSALLSYSPKPLYFAPNPLSSKPVSWYRPLTLDDLLVLKDAHPTAKLVIGNTELGIESKFKNRHYEVLIGVTHIESLNSLTVSPSGTSLLIGSSVTLTKLMQYLKGLAAGTHADAKRVNAKKVNATELCEMFVQQLRWFSSTQIRNVCAIGGNICTASPISDLNPVLQACDAVFHVRSQGGKKEGRLVKARDFFQAYRTIDLKPEEVLVSIEVPFPSASFHYLMPYKQARRRDDDISIVCAGMNVQLEQNKDKVFVVKDLCVSLGGVSPTTRTVN